MLIVNLLRTAFMRIIFALPLYTQIQNRTCHCILMRLIWLTILSV